MLTRRIFKSTKTMSLTKRMYTVQTKKLTGRINNPAQNRLNSRIEKYKNNHMRIQELG